MSGVLETEKKFFEANLQQPAQELVLYEATVISPEVINTSAEWTIGLFEVGDHQDFCFALWCPCAAKAFARNTLDGSDWWVNCCMSVSASRFLVRTAYNIPGNAHWDCWVGTFCPCFAANQMFQTSKVKGRIVNTGPDLNINDRIHLYGRSWRAVVYDCAYACLCLPCAIGYTLESSGVPFWFGACCFSPLAAVNVQRYTRKVRPLAGTEFLVDCYLPAVFIFGTPYIVGTATNYLVMPWFCQAFIDENARVDRPDCWYGCDVMSCLRHCYSFLKSGCTCPVHEGRYLSPQNGEDNRA